MRTSVSSSRRKDSSIDSGHGRECQLDFRTTSRQNQFALFFHPPRLTLRRTSDMALKFFNTLSRSVQEFAPSRPGGIGMYCCGPTVYDFAHIGNWRTFVFGDLVRRYLEFCGYDVRHVMNITDVEDKIIKRVRETGTSLRDFTGQYEVAFLDDMKSLGCRLPHHTPRATEHIPEIISLIERLVARDIAYKATDGSVYFSIKKYRGCGCNYGQLVKLNFDEMRPGERVSSDEYEKDSLADFALWKARAP